MLLVSMYTVFGTIVFFIGGHRMGWEGHCLEPVLILPLYHYLRFQQVTGNLKIAPVLT